MKVMPGFVALPLAVAAASALFAGCGTDEKSATSPTQEPTASTATTQPTSASDEWDSVPSGSLLFLSRGYSSNLYAINADGSGLTQLTDSAEHDGVGAFSPDGKLFAYTAFWREDGADGVYVMSPDGSNAHLVATNARSGEYASDPRWASFISWSPQGMILYRQEAHQVYADYGIVDPNSSNRVRISQDNACMDPVDWSPDGQNLVLCQCTSDLIHTLPCTLSIVDQRGTVIRTLVEDAPAMLTSPKWSPDGSNILFINGNESGSLSVIDADGSNLRSLLQVPAYPNLGRPQWSPDGSQIFLTTSDQILVVSLIDGSTRTIANGSISPDGSKIAVRKDGEIDIISVADGSSDAIVNAADIGGLFWSPNGDRIGYTSCEPGQDGQCTLFIVNSDGSEIKNLASHIERYVGIDWSPDGKRIIFSSSGERRAGVWWVSPDGSDKRWLKEPQDPNIPFATPTVQGVIGGCKKGPDHVSCLSPDGTTEALIPSNSGALAIEDVASGATRDITIDGAEVYSALPVWSNDGTRVVVHAGDPNTCQRFYLDSAAPNSEGCKLYVVDVATGEAKSIAEDARWGESEPSVAWSPDGSYIYYVKGTVCTYGCTPGLLYRVHPDGTGQERIADIRVGLIYGFKP